MKNQVLVGYQVFKKIHVKLSQKTLASLTKWSIDTKFWNICLQQRQIFHGHRIFQHFYHVTSFKSINIVFETGKYHSWPNTLPFWVGYWGANSRTPWSNPSTRSSPNYLYWKPAQSQNRTMLSWLLPVRGFLYSNECSIANTCISSAEIIHKAESALIRYV